MQFSRLEHPVVNVSWHDAVAYCAWLKDCTGEPWRLLTEAEWEKAARWDEKTRSARVYPWGQEFDPHRCNTRESSLGATTPVGLYPNGASPAGAQDMAGNVREWTSTRYASYPYERLDGRERADARGERVQRGGSWFSFGSDARCAFRDWHDPDETSAAVGFRLALEAPPQVAGGPSPLSLPGS
jgi:formylglycine-generating enzyme required for sulfatase activity